MPLSSFDLIATISVVLRGQEDVSYLLNRWQCHLLKIEGERKSKSINLKINKNEAINCDVKLT